MISINPKFKNGIPLINGRLFRSIGRVPEFTDQRDENKCAQVFLGKLSVVKCESIHALTGGFRAEGDDDSSPLVQLLLVRRRQLLCRCSDDDGIEGSSLCKTESPIIGVDVDIVIAESLESPGRLFGKFGDAFDSMDFTCEL